MSRVGRVGALGVVVAAGCILGSPSGRKACRQALDRVAASCGPTSRIDFGLIVGKASAAATLASERARDLLGLRNAGP